MLVYTAYDSLILDVSFVTHMHEDVYRVVVPCLLYQLHAVQTEYCRKARGQ
jgi:hypothetical protein